ncbi:MAG: putative collagen-binding domain-containing protein, partial [Candidatus Latescibacteria bacterium]|nr:putative collagen-binding domain-containing protein [Candidatus Latescibacterota bacterium]
IRVIQEYEQTKSKQHLVGMTGAPVDNPELFASPAEWISPRGRDYIEDPLTGDGTKIVVHDTDHTHPFNTDPKTPWRSFLRGLNFISMDPYMDCRYDSPGEPVPEFSDIRRQCGYTLQWAQRLNLNAVEPHGDLVSSGYCLSDRDTEYLVYLPNGGEVTVDLSGASENFEVEWFNPQVGESERGEAVNGGQLQDFAAPFEGHAVLFLDRRIGEAYNERSE